jgi:hypothetical protein
VPRAQEAVLFSGSTLVDEAITDLEVSRCVNRDPGRPSLPTVIRRGNISAGDDTGQDLRLWWSVRVNRTVDHR